MLVPHCHKSHHYGLVVDGAQVAYLDGYPIGPYSITGAVPLREINDLVELAGAAVRQQAALVSIRSLDPRLRPGLRP